MGRIVIQGVFALFWVASGIFGGVLVTESGQHSFIENANIYVSTMAVRVFC